MDNESVGVSFGAYLKTIRMQKGISLREVSEETRIGEEMLTNLENEDHERLPADVFVKGFLRAYAKAIGASGDEAIRLYNMDRNTLGHPSRAEGKAEVMHSRSGFKFWFTILLALIILCGIIGVSIFFQNGDKAKETPPAIEKKTENPPAEEKPVKETSENILQEDDNELLAEGEGQVAEETPEEVELPDIPEEIAQQKKTADSPYDKVEKTDAKTETKESKVVSEPKTNGKTETADARHRLYLEAVEETWLKVIIDEKDPLEYLLEPGDSLDLTAKTGFNILIGNAGGVKMTYNGEPYHISGKSGQVVTAQIP